MSVRNPLVAGDRLPSCWVRPWPASHPGWIGAGRPLGFTCGPGELSFLFLPESHSRRPRETRALCWASAGRWGPAGPGGTSASASAHGLGTRSMPCCPLPESRGCLAPTGCSVALPLEGGGRDADWQIKCLWHSPRSCEALWDHWLPCNLSQLRSSLLSFVFFFKLFIASILFFIFHFVVVRPYDLWPDA